MKASLRFALVASFLLCTTLPAGGQQAPPGAGQAEFESYVGRLPETTVFYASWRSPQPFAQVRAQNGLLRLLDAPEMKANWEALQKFYREMAAYQEGKKPEEAAPAPQPAAPPEITWQEFVSLLDNALLFAVVPASAAAPRPEPAVLYLYDTTGKEALLAELEARGVKKGDKLQTYEWEGLKVVETLNAQGKPTAYEARMGKWLVGGDKKAETEAWMRAIRTAPARSLKDAAAYQRSREGRGANEQLEVFLNLATAVRALEEIPLPPNAPISPAQVAQAAGLKQWEAVLLRLGLEPTRGRYQMAALRDPAVTAGAAIVGPAVTDFPSLDLAPPNALGYSVSEWNPGVFWAFLWGVVPHILPPPQLRVAEGFRAMSESLLGMKAEELAGALGNEFAQIIYPTADGQELHTLTAHSLRDRARVVTAVRNFGTLPLLEGKLRVEQLPAAPDEPDVVHFRFVPMVPEGVKPVPGVYAALTPNWLLLADHQEDVRQALAQSAGKSSLRRNARFQQARARFPRELCGFGYFDLDGVIATGALTKAIREFAQSAVEEAQRQRKQEKEREKAEPPAPEGGTAPVKPAQAAAEPAAPMPPELKIPRGFVKWFLTATTRDVRGLYQVSYLE